MQHCKSRPTRIRSDGWTPDRQARFIENLARTRSVTAAARAVGMSRESAHRLRKRDPHGLFAAAWDRAMGAGRVALTRAEIEEGHIRLIARACGTEGANLRIRSVQHQLRDLPSNRRGARTATGG